MDNKKIKILFVCRHNSARSQMAEAFLNQLGGNQFEAKSAGLEPGTLNPNVVKIMAEIGIDISGNHTKGTFDLFSGENQYQAVITVCDAANAEKCPVFPGRTKRLVWSFPDPSIFSGTQEEILEQTRKVRDNIRTQVTEFIQEAGIVSYWI